MSILDESRASHQWKLAVAMLLLEYRVRGYSEWCTGWLHRILGVVVLPRGHWWPGMDRISVSLAGTKIKHPG
jgi:hypothetical protein